MPSTNRSWCRSRRAFNADGTMEKDELFDDAVRDGAGNQAWQRVAAATAVDDRLQPGITVDRR